MSWRENNIEFIFNEDSRDKKRTASGAYHRASRRGYIRGGVRTQSDFLTAKERKKLNGEVKMSNKYEKLENLPKKIEFVTLEEDLKRTILKTARGRFTNAQIMKQMGISSGGLYKYYDDLGIQTNKKDNRQNYARALEDLKNAITHSDICKLRDNLGIPQRGYLDIKFMDRKKRYDVLKNIAGSFQRAELVILLGVSKTTVDKILKEHDLSITFTKRDGALVGLHKKLQKKKGNDTIVESITEPPVEENPVNDKICLEDVREIVERALEQNKAIPVEKPKQNGFTINLSGKYSKQEIENKLLSIAGILSDEKQYEIDIELREK